MHINTRHQDPWFGFYWWHRWENGRAAVEPRYVDKHQAWRPLRQRPRDGTVVRHKTGGLRRVS